MLGACPQHPLLTNTFWDTDELKTSACCVNSAKSFPLPTASRRRLGALDVAPAEAAGGAKCSRTGASRPGAELPAGATSSCTAAPRTHARACSRHADAQARFCWPHAGRNRPAGPHQPRAGPAGSAVVERRASRGRQQQAATAADGGGSASHQNLCHLVSCCHAAGCCCSSTCWQQWQRCQRPGALVLVLEASRHSRQHGRRWQSPVRGQGSAVQHQGGGSGG